MTESKVDERNPEFLARDGWRHIDEWKRSANSFLVTVKRHSNDWAPRADFEREHHWCVYLYVYDNHPDFARFNPDWDMWSQPGYDCHSYVSLFRVHRDEKGKITSFQLGWDYSHDGDYQFSQYATPGEASSVFYDANRLFVEMTERAALAACTPAKEGVG